MRIEFVDQVDSSGAFAKRLTLPRRGLPQLGTILKQAGHEVYISSESVQPIDWQEVLKADVVGFTVYTQHTPLTYRSAQWLKTKAGEQGKKITILMGGPHVTALPEEALTHGADFVVRHEGEGVIVSLVETIADQNEEALWKIPNLTWRTKEGKFVCNDNALQRINLDDNLNPDFTLIRGWRKPGRLSLVRYQYVPLEASRGCCYDCEFCYSGEMFPGGITYRDKEMVVEEIDQLLKQGHDRFLFSDDSFLLNSKKAYGLLELMAERGIRCKSWNAQLGIKAIIQANRQYPDIFELMKRTGAGRQFVPIESINSQTLSDYNKPHQLDEIEQALSILNQHDIPVSAMFVFGGDGDTIESIESTIQFVLKHPLKTITATMLTPLPGTPLFTRLQQEGRFLDGEQDYPGSWAHYNLVKVVFSPLKMSPQQLQESMFRVLEKFYSLSRIVKDIGNSEELLGKLYVRNRIVPRMKKSGRMD